MRMFDRMNFGESKTLRRNDDRPRDGFSLSWNQNSSLTLAGREMVARSRITESRGFYSKSWSMSRIKSRVSRGPRLLSEPLYMDLQEVEALFPQEHPDGSPAERIRLSALDFACTVYVETAGNDQESAIEDLKYAYRMAMRAFE